MASKIVWNYRELDRVRKAPLLDAELVAIATEWVGRLNAELNSAQADRGQPVEDGYAFELHHRHDRSMVNIIAFTARAQAHEAKHSSILKLMRTAGDTKVRGHFVNPTKGFTAGTDARGEEIHRL